MATYWTLVMVVGYCLVTEVAELAEEVATRGDVGVDQRV